MYIDKTMELAHIAAGIITDVMGPGLSCKKISYTADGNDMMFEFQGYPLYQSWKRGSVYLRIPRNSFYIRKNCVKFTPIPQTQCRFFEGTIGQPFRHPHIFSDGTPCWHGGLSVKPVDFLCTVIETLALSNVNHISVFTGKCASGCMSYKDEAIANAAKQQKVVIQKLGSRPIVKNRGQLGKYVSEHWRREITALIDRQ